MILSGGGDAIATYIRFSMWIRRAKKFSIETENGLLGMTSMSPWRVMQFRSPQYLGVGRE